MATSKKKRAARKSSNGSPQLQICSALLQNDLAREAIAEALPDLTPAQIASALNNAKSHGRIAWIEKASVFRLTKSGKDWVGAGAADAPPEDATQTPTRGAAGRKSAHRRARKPRVKTVDTSPPADEESADATFRCAVMSDGCFFISKHGVNVELDADEHRQMLAYLERMAVLA